MRVEVRWMRATVSAKARSGTTRRRRCGGVDITGKLVLRWVPATGERQQWPVPDFPSAVVLRRGGGALVAMRDGLYFLDPETGGLELFCRPDADRPRIGATRRSAARPAISGWARWTTTCTPTARRVR